MIVEPFKPEHLMRLDEQEMTAWLKTYVRPEHAEILAASPSYTGRVGDQIIACAGVLQYWPGRGEAWAFLAKDSGKHFVAIHRAVRSFFSSFDMARIEAAVDKQFIQGQRWVELLGFDMEVACARKYFPNGRDAVLYAKVNHG